MAKPRGLKASVKAAAFVPAPESTSSHKRDTGSSSAISEKRTYPTDGDALTLDDLFELKLSAQRLLDPAGPPTSEQEDEGRGLLRGILHGCDALIKLVASASGSSDENARSWFTFSGQDRIALPAAGDIAPTSEMQEQHKSLGLLRFTAPAQIAYLQAFALHELGNHLEPSPSVAQAAISAAEGSTKATKRRKVDVHEPKTSDAWLDEALARYKLSVDWWRAATSAQTDEDVAHSAERAFECIAVHADAARAVCDRATLAFLQNSAGSGAREMLHSPDTGVCASLTTALRSLTRWCESRNQLSDPKDPDNGAETYDFFEVQGEPVPVVLRAVGALLQLVERFPEALDQSAQRRILSKLDETLDDEVRVCVWGADTVETDGSDLADHAPIGDVLLPDSAGAPIPGSAHLAADNHPESEENRRRKLQTLMLRADIALARFILEEDEIERKYRPDNDSDDDDEGDEDADDDEVVPLPDADDVTACRHLGNKALDLLWKSLSALQREGAKTVDSRKAQVQKLEETCLLMSAVINPDDVRETEVVERQLAAVQREMAQLMR